jgi:hypothetical protein
MKFGFRIESLLSRIWGNNFYLKLLQERNFISSTKNIWLIDAT